MHLICSFVVCVISEHCYCSHFGPRCTLGAGEPETRTITLIGICRRFGIIIYFFENPSFPAVHHFCVSAACCIGGNIEAHTISLRYVCPKSTQQVCCNIAVCMSACHAEGPGSIPGGAVCLELVWSRPIRHMSNTHISQTMQS